jgi:CxxC motif-containing protein (DUF1111 family)
VTLTDIRRNPSSIKQFTLRNATLAICAVCAVTAIGCEASPEDESAAEQSDAIPVPHLTVAAQSRFQAGAAEFGEVESSSAGLGPLFNGSSCHQCHNSPVPGGASSVRLTHVACRAQGARADTLLHLFSTRPDIASAVVPPDCDVVVAQRRTTSLLGAGLIEAIADADIEALAETQPSHVAGRAAHVKDLVSGKRRVGRFGWKAQYATLESFAGDAYRNELGITNELFPTEVAPHGDASLLLAMDPIPDPEAQVGALRRLADFMRLLAAPEAGPTPVEGAALFMQLGCETCHHREFRSASDEPSLDRKDVRLYSDLLLHDVGTSDGIAQADASADELRTPPLWGVRHAQLWLHDGRAASLDEAIRLHGAQALEAREAYEELDDDARLAVIAFLNSL